MKADFNDIDVAIVGAGMTGLTAAYYLQQKGYRVKVFDAAPCVGGRMRTDKIEGFTLDRGFHIFHTAYKEAQELLDYNALKLKSIYQGVLVRHADEFNLLSHPFKQGRDILSMLIANIGNWKDKLKMLALITKLDNWNDQKIFGYEEISVLEFLKKEGFSEKFINSFFKPFLGAVFLESRLHTSARFLLYVLKMFSSGEATMPADGIAAIPNQIAAKLKADTIVLQTKVKKVGKEGITLLKGDFIPAKKVLVATNAIDLKLLQPEFVGNMASNHVTCLYFASETPPINKPIMILNGEGKGLVNNICVVNLIQPKYAPEGQNLISVCINKHHDLDDDELVDEVMKEMVPWFGVKVNDWEHIKTYHIKYALPYTKEINPNKLFCRIEENVYAGGDHLAYGCMNAAIKSGKAVAVQLDSELKFHPDEVVMHRA